MGQSKAVILGYGPADLLTQVKKAGWVDYAPPDTGKNFVGFSIDGYVLADEPDPLCPVKFRLTLENLSTGTKFEVSGYCYKEIVPAIAAGVLTTGNVTFAGQYLSSNPRPHLCRFAATIEVIK